jgi:hypothetical protein
MFHHPQGRSVWQPPLPPLRRSPGSRRTEDGALGLISSIVIGVASTAPGYSLAATIGYISQQVGTRGPIIVLLAFIAMLFISYAYKALNNIDPDCGTTFTWVSRALFVLGIGSILIGVVLMGSGTSWRRRSSAARRCAGMWRSASRVTSSRRNRLIDTK